MPERLHAGLAGFLDRRELTNLAERRDGAVVINADRSYRVYCRPAPHGDLVFESRLMLLPDGRSDADEVMRRCLLASWVRMGTHADVVVLADDGAQLLLQQRLPADATVDEVEQSLECFINSIADWRRVLRIL
jgi:hypothetical protein